MVSGQFSRGGASYPRGQFSGGQSSRGKLSGRQLPRRAIFPGRNCPDTYLSEEFYTTEPKILNASICIFQPSGKIKIAGSYWDVDFPLFLFHLFLETMLLSIFYLEFFLKSNRFWFQKNDGKNIGWRHKEMVGKMHKMIKTIYMKLDFTVI